MRHDRQHDRRPDEPRQRPRVPGRGRAVGRRPRELRRPDAHRDAHRRPRRRRHPHVAGRLYQGHVARARPGTGAGARHPVPRRHPDPREHHQLDGPGHRPQRTGPGGQPRQQLGARDRGRAGPSQLRPHRRHLPAPRGHGRPHGHERRHGALAHGRRPAPPQVGRQLRAHGGRQATLDADRRYLRVPHRGRRGRHRHRPRRPVPARRSHRHGPRQPRGVRRRRGGRSGRRRAVAGLRRAPRRERLRHVDRHL